MGDTRGLMGHRLSMARKEADGKKWYREHMDMLDGRAPMRDASRNGMMRPASERMRANYELFNNRIDKADFEHICNPYGLEGYELPVKMTNRDIVSGKIKALLGMEMRMPFQWRVFAVNPEATSRKEREFFLRVRELLAQEVAEAVQPQPGSMPSSPGDRETPGDVRRYMEREHQDPAEIMAHQLLEYLTQRCDLRNVFNVGFKHLCLSAQEVYYVGIFNEQPTVRNVNSLRFRCDTSADSYRIEDGEWATCEYMMTSSEVVQHFGDALKPDELDSLYEGASQGESQTFWGEWATDSSMAYRDGKVHRVLHCVWKSLRRIKFLTYTDADGVIQRTIVGESYRLNEAAGDVLLEEQWVPEVYEGWKVGYGQGALYLRMQPVPGQFKDLDDVYRCKLPYYGVICDNMNAEPVSIMDRLKPYQYYYNIVMYRLELLMASDKGKKVLMNINAIPSELGIDVKKWQYFFESTPFMWFNPSEEGVEGTVGGDVAKQIDLSLSSDIGRYIDLAEYIRRQAGQAVGITDRIEGEVGNRETSSNYRQSLQQSGNILEPYFNLHAVAKRNVLEALLEVAKVAYATYRPEKLVYITDEYTQRIIDLDVDLLSNSSYGLFVSDSFELEEFRETVQQLAHAAMQTGAVDLPDMLSMLRNNSSVEAEEIVRAGIARRKEEAEAARKQEQEAMAQEEEKQRQFEREKHQMRLEEIRLQETERRKTETIKASLTGASFNPEIDANADGRNDFVEIAAQNGLKIQEMQGKRQLEQEKMAQQAAMDRERMALERERLDVERERIRAQKRDRS